MAKGVHSKRRKRNQSIKRKVLEEKQWGPALQATSTRLLKRTFGLGDDSVHHLKKNAFRYPNDPAAAIPQAKAPVFVERRSNKILSQYLVKEKGMKHKNILKKENASRLESELKKVHDKVEGNVREGEVIDLNKLVEMDEYGNIKMNEEIEIEKFSSKETVKKNKSKKMDVDHMEMAGDKTPKKVMNIKKKRKNKSHFLVNY